MVARQQLKVHTDVPTMKGLVILHVEDDPNDLFLVQRALGKAQLGVMLQPVTDGAKALEYLSGTGPYADRTRFPFPQLVLLDLKLPVLNGFEVLSSIKKDELLQRLPVAILSSSDHFEDRERARKLGADNYFIKTVTFSEVVQHVSKLISGGDSRAVPQQAPGN